MDVLIAFGLFAGLVAGALAVGWSMIIPLAAGAVLFYVLARRHGFAAGDTLRMAWSGVKESFLVVGILLLIGGMTGIWRACGTIACFVQAGIRLIPGQLFILAAFLLAAGLSYAIGTSFGVTATAGVILMTIARAGGANLTMTAGAILSGVYVGDRGSPSSSCANLVAGVTGTDIRRNIRDMLKSALVPFALCVALYAVLSVRNPVQSTDAQLLREMAEEYNLRPICLAPAVLMIALPFCRVPVRWSMAVSIAVSVGIAVFTQNQSVGDCVRAMALGYTPRSENLTAVLSGGGVRSMVEISAILLLSGSYGGIFRGTGLLDGVTGRLERLAIRIGRYGTVALAGLASCMLFCNQTIGIMMTAQLTEGLYADGQGRERMLDIADSVVCLAGVVPWCIACSVPLGMLEMGVRAVPFAFYLWLIPLWALIRSRRREK